MIAIAKRHIWEIFVFVLLGLMIPSSGKCCSCGQVSVLKSFESSDCVFVGTMVQKVDPHKDDQILSSGDLVEYTFAVDFSWKAADLALVVIQSARSGVSCGYNFLEGRRYVVFASERRGVLMTGMCSGNTLSAAAWEARYLLPQPIRVNSEAQWQSLTRNDLLELLESSSDGSWKVAAQLLAKEFEKPGKRTLSVASLLLVDPKQSSSFLDVSKSMEVRTNRLIEFGFEVMNSEDISQRVAAVKGLGLLAQKEELNKALGLGFADPSSRVKQAARLVLIECVEYLTEAQAETQIKGFISSIEGTEKDERWVGIHQLRFFSDQKEIILPFLAALADTVSPGNFRNTVLEVQKELTEKH